MKLTRYLCLFLAALSPPLFAQSTAGPFTINSSTSPCATISTQNKATVGISVTGTFSMTLQPEVAIRGNAQNTQVTPANSSTPQATITSANNYSAGVGGYDTFSLCVTSYVSGSATIVLNAVNQNNAALFGGPGTVFPLTTAGTVNSGGSIAPSGSGQILGTGAVLPNGIITPSASVSSTTGGTIGNVAFSVEITYNTVLGETYPSTSTALSISTCGGGACQVTVTAPSFLPPGVTGYTVYDCAAAACVTPTFSRQTALANCVNITGNCVISTPGAGTTPPTANTAWVQPPNVQTDECPPGVIPSIFTPDQSGNFHTTAGVDVNSNNSRTTGTLEFCRSVWFNDTLVSPPTGNNAMVAFTHTWGQNVSTANQDRAVHVFAQTVTNDSASHYGLEGLQSEVIFNCSGCTLTGTPDGEVSAVSASNQDNHTGLVSGPPYGLNGLRALVNRANTGTWGSCTECIIGANIIVNNNNAATYSSGFFTGIAVTSAPGVSSAVAANYRGIHIRNTGLSNIVAGENIEQLIIDDAGTGATFNNFISNAANEETGTNLLQGKTYVQHLAAGNTSTAGFAYTPPTCSATGVGTGSCAVRAGSADSLGRMVLTVSGGTGAGTGTATITFHTAFTSPNTDVSCQATLEDNTGTWNGLAVIRVSATHSLSAVTFNWTNGTTPTTLGNGTYDINYECWGS